MTSPKQISLFTEEALTSSQGDSHANPIPQQGKEKERKMNAIYGPKCCEQLGKFSHVGSWAKTFSALLIGQGDWYSTRCKLIWKLKGTKYGRMYFQLRPLALPIEGTEFGLLPTPTAMDSTNATATMKSSQVKEGSMHSVTLTRAISMGMLPTPNQRDYKDNVGNGKDAPSIGVTRGYSLGQKINLMLPTLIASNCGDKVTRLENQDLLTKRARLETGTTSQLNPRFVLEMMGFPPDWTELPFLNGEMNQSRPPETR